MPQVQVPRDARISDIVAKLDRPEEYVRRVLGNMYGCKTEAPAVRIGVQGSGAMPNYRLESSDGGVSDPVILGTYHGQGHGQLFEDNEGLDPNHWSTRVMSRLEVAALLGDLRKLNKR